MNKVYKVIWNRTKQCYIVVSEFAKQAGKVKSTHLFATMGKTTAAVGLGAALLFPLGGNECICRSRQGHWRRWYRKW